MSKNHPTVDGVFLAAVQEAIDHGSAGGEWGSFNAVADHAVRLLGDALGAFRDKSFGTAVFLAITGIEETAKAEMTIYRKPRQSEQRGRRADPLYNHKKKHLIGVRPTTFMSPLRELLGEEKCLRLQQEAQSGALIAQRESALYVSFDEEGVHAPSTIQPERARELLLLALYVADDILVGYTDHGWALELEIQRMIDEVSGDLSGASA